MEEKLLVLVVDDEAIIRIGAVEMLEEAGFAVVEARNSDDAMEILESRSDVRAVFTDINMPGQDGFALIEQVRNDPQLAETIIIVLTSGERRLWSAKPRSWRA